MKLTFNIRDISISVSPYNTEQEKEFLLLSSFTEANLDNALDILKVPTEILNKLSDDEKKVLLYKFREISIGDEIDQKFTCDNCGQGNDGVINTSGFLIEPKKSNPNIKKLNVDVNDNTLQLFVEVEVDDLDIGDYDKLMQEVKDNQYHINFIKTCNCLKCGRAKPFDLSNTKFIIDIMSEDSLMSLYKSYNALVYFGHYSKKDVDSMYPFERSIFIGLLNKTKEDLNK